MVAREESKKIEDLVETAFAEFHEAWFADDRLDPHTFCRNHPECGPVLRERIDDFLFVMEGLSFVSGLIEKEGSFETAGRMLGDFHIIREIGRGGMGTVYEAEQVSLKRKVALKILPPHLGSSGDVVMKFRREAEAGGRQNHPGIVSVLATGEHEGLHYIAQELVKEGATLADQLDSARTMGMQTRAYFREKAQLVTEIADALQHAHESGVIHRDIKPSNILITSDGRPKVTDFGLARIEDALALSRTGEFDGTPYYMSPEQAVGHRSDIDGRTDIYSLGVTLYEILTLKKPFEGKTSYEVLKKVVIKDPDNPRITNPAVPRDLAVICLKAMEKEPEKRYQTMKDLGDDLRRFISGEPIRAKPAGIGIRLIKRVRKNPWAAGVVALTVLLLISLTLLMVPNQPHDISDTNDADHPSPIIWNDGHTGQFTSSISFSPDGSRILTVGERDFASVRLWDAYTLEHLGCLDLKRGHIMRNAFSPDGESILVLEASSENVTLLDGRGGELIAELKGGGSKITSAVYSPDGRRIATADGNGKILFWDALKATRLPSLEIETTAVMNIEFDETGSRILSLCLDKKARLWNTQSGEHLSTIGDEDHTVDFVSFCQDGKHIITHDAQKNSIRLWSGQRAEISRSFKHDHDGYERYIMGNIRLKSMVSTDGKRLVTVDDGHVLLWDIEQEKTLEVLDGILAEFSPDGETIITICNDHIMRLWDGTTGRLIKSCNDPAQHKVYAYRFSPSGRRIAAIHRLEHVERGQNPWLWNGRNGDLIGECKGGIGSVDSMTFSPSGDRLLKCGYGNHADLWDADSTEMIGRLQPHSRKIWRFSLNVCNGQIVTAPFISFPQEKTSITARLWNLLSGEEIRSFEGPSLTCGALALSPDGSMLALGGQDQGRVHFVLMLFDTATGKRRDVVTGHQNGISSAVFSPDGNRILSLSYGDMTARLFDVNSGEMIAAFHDIDRGGSEADIPLPAFSPGGEFLVIPFDDDTAKIVESVDGTVLPNTLRYTGRATQLCFNPDGRVLVICSSDHLLDSNKYNVSLWETESWKKRYRSYNDIGWSWACFSPDGTLLATTKYDHQVSIWSVQDLVNAGAPGPVQILEGDAANRLGSIVFSPDGHRILAVDHDRMAHLWDVRTGKRLHVLKGHTDKIWKALFTHDGKRIVTGGCDTSIRIWDSETGRLLLTRVEYERGNWLAFEPGFGYYMGTPDATEWARIRVDDIDHPLSSYSSIFHKPEYVRASLEGRTIEAPLYIPTAPDLDIIYPAASGIVQSVSILLEASAEDRYGIKEVTVRQDGHEIPAAMVEQALKRSPGGRRVRLSMELSIPEDHTSTTIKVRARNVRGIFSETRTIYQRITSTL